MAKEQNCWNLTFKMFNKSIRRIYAEPPNPLPSICNTRLTDGLEKVVLPSADHHIIDMMCILLS